MCEQIQTVLLQMFVSGSFKIDSHSYGGRFLLLFLLFFLLPLVVVVHRRLLLPVSLSVSLSALGSRRTANNVSSSTSSSIGTQICNQLTAESSIFCKLLQFNPPCLPRIIYVSLIFYSVCFEISLLSFYPRILVKARSSFVTGLWLTQMKCLKRG